MSPGDVVPPLERRLDLASLIGYAAATWDWYGIHFDPDAFVAARLPAPLVDGQMLGALLATHALDAFGGRGTVRRMSFRFRSIVVAGETIRCVGEVESVEGNVVRLKQRVIAGERVVVEPATTEIELPEGA